MTLWLYYRFAYRPMMRLTHRFNWHYAPPIYPDGDTQLWCKWCGFRETVRMSTKRVPVSGGPSTEQVPVRLRG